MPHTKAKKLVLVLAISALMTEASKEANLKVQERAELQRYLLLYLVLSIISRGAYQLR